MLMKILKLIIFFSFAININYSFASIEIIQTKNATQGLCNGFIEIEASGDGGPFSALIQGSGLEYQVDEINGKYTFGELCPGSYTIIVYGPDCETTLMTELYDCTEIDLGTITINGPSTCNDEDGSIFIEGPITGGTPPYFYKWSNGQTGNPVTNLGPGIANLTLTDAHGCKELEFFLFQSTGMPIIEGSTTNTCEGLNNGTIKLFVTNQNGSNDFSYHWSNGSNSSNLENLSEGNYRVTVTDNLSGCIAEKLFHIFSIPSNGPILIEPILHHSCSDLSGSELGTGSIITDIVGGTPPFNYSWSNGQAAQGIYFLPPGAYQLTVTDLCEQEATASFTIESSLPEHHNVDFTNLCEDNMVAVEIYGKNGTPPYHFEWDNGESGTANLFNLPSGLHFLTITDFIGCSQKQGLFVPYLPDEASVHIDPYQIVSCDNNPEGGTMTATPTGNPPFSFAWTIEGSNNILSTEQTLTNITQTATYCVTVTDACGNTASDCHLIYCDCSSASTPLSVVMIDIENECIATNTTTVSIKNEYNYNWGGGASCRYRFYVTWPNDEYGIFEIEQNIGYNTIQFVSGTEEVELAPGNHEIKISNDCGCEFTQNISIGVEKTHFDPFIENLNEDFPAAAPLNVISGCTECQDCGLGFIPDYTFAPDGDCNTNDETQLFSFSPGDKTNPCLSGGIITCPTATGDVIEIPDFVGGFLIVNWDEPINDCTYRCGCLFSASDLVGVEGYIYVTTEYVISENCEDSPDPPVVDCPPPYEIQIDEGACTSELICIATGETVETYDHEVVACIHFFEFGVAHNVYSFCAISEETDWEEDPSILFLTASYNASEYTDEEVLDMYPPGTAFCQITLTGGNEDNQFTSNTNTKLSVNELDNDLQIENNIPEAKISIFPNPFNDILNLMFVKDGSEAIQIEAYDILGRIVYSKKAELINQEHKIKITETSQWHPGIYTFVVRDDKGLLKTFKLVKTNNPMHSK